MCDCTSVLHSIPISEPRHDKTNKVSVASEGSYQPGHPDQSSLCIQWVAKDSRFLHADSEDSDQTRWMPRLIRVFDGRTLMLLVLSCRGSSTEVAFRTKLGIPGNKTIDAIRLIYYLFFFFMDDNVALHSSQSLLSHFR